MNAIDHITAAEADLELLADEIDMEIKHIYPLVEAAKHLLCGWPVQCPCSPEVKMYRNTTLIVHRRTQ